MNELDSNSRQSSRRAVDRGWAALLAVTWIGACWLGMMVVHEAGHILAARMTGGTVTQVVLHPAAISRTNVFPNPSPGMVAWTGPLGGVLIPIAMWALFLWLAKGVAFLLRFFAGFCLLANGAYLGFGVIDGVGDAGDLLRAGSAAWQLVLFGVLTMPLGLWMWHGLGSRFGWGANARSVSPTIALGSAMALGILIIAMLWHAMPT